MDGTRVIHVKQSSPDPERQLLHVFSQIQTLSMLYACMKML
jgi:hypothetical protein